MPTRKMNKSKRRSRRRRRKKYNNYLASSGTGLTKTFPIGKRFTFKTRYFDRQVTLNPGAGGVPVSQVYQLNGLYDPDVTGVGAQPIGFDQLMPLYDHYTVIGARARVSVHNSDSTYSQMVILQIKDTNTTSTSIGEIIENGQCNYRTLGPSGSSRSTADLSINCSVKNFFGKPIMGEKDLTGTSSSNPSEGVYLHITGAPVQQVDSGPIYLSVLIEFIAILSEPKQLASS